MQIIDTPVYQKAFAHYLRRGIPIHISLKEQINTRKPAYYIWRTRGDDKVRSSHAANNGKIFAWDSQPVTGHPGEDRNCRCWAEPYYGLINRSLNYISEKTIIILEYFRRLLSSVHKWENRHFVAYFYVGNGRPVTLNEVGHLDDIKAYYEAHYFKLFVSQIRKNAASHMEGKFEDSFKNSYDFRPVLYSHGGATISGAFHGHIINKSGRRSIVGKASFSFSDMFTDPVRLADTALPFLNITSSEWLVLAGDLGGARYAINGTWEIDIEEIIN